jgi:hypothetical protein
MQTPVDYKGEQIIFGNGGGFTGAVTSVALLDNGNLYRMGTSDTSYTYIGKLNENIYKNQFKTFTSLGLDKMKLDEPGNRYFFITKKSEGKVIKLQWGRTKLENPLPKLYYDNMMSLIDKLDKK